MLCTGFEQKAHPLAVAENRGPKVQRQLQVEPAGGDLADRLTEARPDVVDQDVEPAVALTMGREQ